MYHSGMAYTPGSDAQLVTQKLATCPTEFEYMFSTD